LAYRYDLVSRLEPTHVFADLEGNVVYGFDGAGVVTEDGSESHNVFSANFVIGLRAGESLDTLIEVSKPMQFNYTLGPPPFGGIRMGLTQQRSPRGHSMSSTLVLNAQASGLGYHTIIFTTMSLLMPASPPIILTGIFVQCMLAHPRIAIHQVTIML
jgi:hypothetical protein